VTSWLFKPHVGASRVDETLVGVWAVVCRECGSAVAEGARFCSGCGKAAPQPVLAATPVRSAAVGRSLLAQANATVEAVESRLADEGWALEPAVVQGLTARRTAPARHLASLPDDLATREDVIAAVLADAPEPPPDRGRGLVGLLGFARGR
jgi:hypothetical protein